ncbi:MAG: SAF domain-containing protein [Acidimicrobiales bacterium]
MGPDHLVPARPAAAPPPWARLRVTLRRRPVLFWASCVVAVTSSILVVGEAARSATRDAQTYGALVPTVVATAHLEPGRVVEPGDVRITQIPASLAPVGALGDPPVGHVVRQDIVEGEAVVAGRLAGGSAVGVAAVLGADQRGVAIPLPSHRPPLQVGQVVDVLAVIDPGTSPGRIPATLIAERAVVVDVADGGVTVAVSRADAASIVGALPTSVVDVVVHPG